MSLYPHRVKVFRPRQEGGLGAGEYAGVRGEAEELVAQDIPAAIQMKGAGRRAEADLPADALQTTWLILIPAYALPAKPLQQRDIIEDETKVRYQVVGPYFTAFGANLRARRLEL